MPILAHPRGRRQLCEHGRGGYTIAFFLYKHLRRIRLFKNKTGFGPNFAKFT
jgi:hypothetical protein